MCRVDGRSCPRHRETPPLSSHSRVYRVAGWSRNTAHSLGSQSTHTHVLSRSACLRLPRSDTSQSTHTHVLSQQTCTTPFHVFGRFHQLIRKYGYRSDSYLAALNKNPDIGYHFLRLTWVRISMTFYDHLWFASGGAEPPAQKYSVFYVRFDCAILRMFFAAFVSRS